MGLGLESDRMMLVYDSIFDVLALKGSSKLRSVRMGGLLFKPHFLSCLRMSDGA